MKMNLNNLSISHSTEEAWLRRYEDCLNRLDKQKIHRLKSFWHRDITFESPLFNVQEREVVLQNYTHIAQSLNLQKMKVLDIAPAMHNPHLLFSRWEMKIDIGNGPYVIAGMSEITLDMKQSLIIHQKDFWNPDTIFQQLSAIYRWGWSRAVKKI